MIDFRTDKCSFLPNPFSGIISLEYQSTKMIILVDSIWYKILNTGWGKSFEIFFVFHIFRFRKMINPWSFSKDASSNSLQIFVWLYLEQKIRRVLQVTYCDHMKYVYFPQIFSFFSQPAFDLVNRYMIDNLFEIWAYVKCSSQGICKYLIPMFIYLGATRYLCYYSKNHSFPAITALYQHSWFFRRYMSLI